ncbi:hypothetical protein CCHR01_12276 [Colletotrichum chrysophilum]|uniref:DUF7708 domain-containing protein n=1 Tax=Colletotrichum chrysophilum TaxID=1836956 RepID=A0AAD9ABK7_9PEZI|nr:hypothetical protein CCHR01_12276 [Colletotrichum chrysophilum]
MTTHKPTDDANLSIEGQYTEQAVYGTLLHPKSQPVQEFLSRANGSLHPAFDASGFAIERGRLIISVQDFNHSSQGECQEFDEEIDAAVELLPPSKAKSFQEVEAVITKSKNIEMFLGVLPSSSEYVSLLCGALSVVFSAIDKHETLKENVCKAIDEIRMAMGNQEYAAQVYREDRQIHKLMASVCASIFDILGYILRFVGQTSLKKVIMPLLRPATYGDDLPDLLSQLQTRSQHLVERAQLLLHSSIRKSQEASSKMTALQLQEILKISYTLDKLHKFVASGFEDHEGILKSLINDQRSKPIEQLPVSFDVEKLLDDMDYQDSLVADDSSSVLRGYHLTRQEEIVVELLTGHIRLESFVKVKGSTALLLLGGDSCRDTPRSAISYFSANMVKSLTRIATQERSICILSYFCGQHTDDGEPFSSPVELITTFVLQLLSQSGHAIDPEVLIQSRIMDTLYEQKVASVCKLLVNLLDAASKDTLVFCLIDGVSFFESPKRRKEDMVIVVRLLLRHARKRQRKACGAKLKVLFAAPSGCDELHELFEEYEIFTIHDGLHNRDALR